jgi:hypothetical protein
MTADNGRTSAEGRPFAGSYVRTICGIAAGASVFAAACQPAGLTDAETLGTAQMASVPVFVASAPALATLVLEVTAPDISDPLAFNLVMVDGAAADTVTIPAGSDRTITVRGFNAENVETHRGSATVTLLEGANDAVTIKLDPLAGDQPVIVVMGGVTVALSPADTTVRVGGLAQIRGVVLNEVGDTLEVTPVWGSLNPAVATVSAAGEVTGVSGGVAVIVGTYGGSGASMTVSVPSPGEMSVEPLTLFPMAEGVGTFEDLVVSSGESGAWTVSAGALPGGLSLDPAGRLDGAPSGGSKGAYTATLRFDDAASHDWGERAFDITVYGPCPIGCETPLEEVNASVGTLIMADPMFTNEPYSFFIGGPTSALSWTPLNSEAQAVFDGLGIDLAASGELSSGSVIGNGTGYWGRTVLAADASGNGRAISLYWVAMTRMTVDVSSLASGTQGTPYSYDLPTSGGAGDGIFEGIPSTDYAVVAGSLPAGVSLEASSGIFSGTPTESGTFDFTLEIKTGFRLGAPLEYRGQTLTVDLSLTIAPGE